MNRFAKVFGLSLTGLVALGFIDIAEAASCSGPIVPNYQSGTSYTIQSSDKCSLVTLQNTGAIAITLPTPATGISLDFSTNILASANGIITISSGSAATINGSASPLVLAPGTGATISVVNGNWIAIPNSGYAPGMPLTGAGSTAGALLAISTNAGVPVSAPSIDTLTDGTIVIGAFARCAGSASQNYESVCLGYQAGKSITTGSNIVAVGFNALNGDTTGLNNVAVGWDVGVNITTGNWNVLMGHDAGGGILGAGAGNTCIGEGTCWGNGTPHVISNNVAIGDASLFNTQNNSNTAVGAQSFGSATTPQYNVGLGFQSGASVILGAQNTCIGTFSCNTNLVNGVGNILVGYAVDVPSDQSNYLSLGNILTAAGINAPSTSIVTLNGVVSFHNTFTPTCGSGCASIAGNDQVFVTTTGTAQTSITVNFGHTWTATPTCVVTSNSTASVTDIASTSTTAITFGASVALTGGVLNVHCL